MKREFDNKNASIDVDPTRYSLWDGFGFRVER